MSLAIATKENLKAWKSASRADDGRPLEYVLLSIIKKGMEYKASLVASDGYRIIEKYIDPDVHAAAARVNIPRKVVQAAEKSMGKNDRAYIEHGKITIRAATPDIPVVDYDSPVKAIIPFIEQTSFDFPEVKTLLERATAQPFPEKVMVIDPKLLQEVLNQFKSSNGQNMYVELHMAGKNDVLLFKAHDPIDGNEITGGLTPIHS